MDSKVARVVLGLGVIAAAIVLLVVLKNDDEGKSASELATTTAQSDSKAESGSDSGNKPAKPAVPTIVVEDGKPIGGIADLTFEAGEQVRFRVKSDAAEEIHVHGYDIAKEVEAGGTVEFDFLADIEGLFEAELEHLGVQIAELRIEP